MNKSLKILVLITAIGALSAAGFYFFLRGSNQAHLRLIPKESSFVMSINMKSLWSKIDYPRLRKMSSYNHFVENLGRKDAFDLLAQIIHDPGESGIDFSSQAFLFGSRGRYRVESGGLVFAINDESKFEKLIRKTDTDGGIEKDEKYKYVKISDGLVLGWTKSAAAIYMNMDKDKALKKLDNLMVQEKKESIEADKRFQHFLEKEADAGLWINYKDIVGLAPIDIGKELLSQGDMDKAAINLFLNFEQNRFGLSMGVSYDDDAEISTVNVFQSKGVSEDHLSMISDDKVYAIAALSLNIKAFIESLSKDKEMRNSIAEMRNEMGLSQEDMETLITGELSFALVNFDDMIKEEGSTSSRPPLGSVQKNADIFHTVQYDDLEDEDPYSTYNELQFQPHYIPRRPSLPGMVFAISAKEPAALERLLKKMNVEKRDDGLYAMDNGLLMFYGVIAQNGLMVTNNLDLATQLLKKQKFKVPSGQYHALVTENPMAMWVDLNLSHYPEKLLTQMERNMGKGNFLTFKEAISKFTMLEMKGNAQSADLWLNMTDDKESSLMRILELVDEAEN